MNAEASKTDHFEKDAALILGQVRHVVDLLKVLGSSNAPPNRVKCSNLLEQSSLD